MRVFEDSPLEKWLISSVPRLCITIPVAAGIGAVGSIASAAIGGSAAKSAAKTQKEAAEEAMGISKQMYDTTRTDLMPYQQVGQGAMAGYQNLLGTGPAGPAGMNAALAATPGYQFALEQGLQATQSGFASKGLAQSGPALKGAAQYAEGLAGTTYQNVLGNYYNALGIGESAAAQTGQFGAQSANTQAQAATAAGAASAAGTVGAANATIQGINGLTSSISNALLTPAMFSAMAGGKGLFA